MQALGLPVALVANPTSAEAALCEHLDAAADRCRKSGCYLALKLWVARERCPIEKW
jgi:hypothetical protein